MNDEQNPLLGKDAVTTRKGDAFIRYFFIDRGGEEGLKMEEAMDDFENYIYKPIASHVMTEYVEEASVMAMEEVLGGDLTGEAMTEQQALEVAQTIGLAVLFTFRELNSHLINPNE